MERLRRAATVYAAYMTEMQEWDRRGITVAHAAVLGAVSSGADTWSDLIFALNLSDSMAVYLIRRLVRSGFLKQVPDQGDRRIRRLVITAKADVALNGQDKEVVFG